jgi:uncharacterized protein with NRDE domain
VLVERRSDASAARNIVCTLAIYVRTFADYPLVVAANRDEFLARPTSAPTILDGDFGIFGGRDDVAKGTWLAVNRRGVVAALLNRRSEDPPDATRHSRGQLCLSMLRSVSAMAAREVVRNEDPGNYNPFTLLVADRDRTWVATNHRAEMRVTDLREGLHLITNLDVNDPTCPRIAASHQLFASLVGGDHSLPATAEFRERLRTILATHDTELDPRGPGYGNSLCVHGPEYGTRSSSLIFLDGAGRWTYFHANDAPCRSQYRREPVMESLSRP